MIRTFGFAVYVFVLITLGNWKGTSRFRYSEQAKGAIVRDELTSISQQSAKPNGRRTVLNSCVICAYGKRS